jgi:hypothetical protein
MAEPRKFGRTNAPQGLGSVNMDDRSIKAQVADGQPVAKNDEMFAVFEPRAAGIVEVRHGLQRVPKHCHVRSVAAGPAGDLVAIVTCVNMPLWTVSTIQVRIHVVAGSLTGSRFTLVVG